MYNSPSPSPIIEFITHHSPSIQRLFISLSSRFPFPPPHLHLLLLYLCNSHRRYLVSWSIITLLLLADLLHECYDFLIAHYSILLLLIIQLSSISWIIEYSSTSDSHQCAIIITVDFMGIYYHLTTPSPRSIQCLLLSHVSLLHSRHCLFIHRHHYSVSSISLHPPPRIGSVL